jgi:hypothetical protein
MLLKNAELWGEAFLSLQQCFVDEWGRRTVLGPFAIIKVTKIPFSRPMRTVVVVIQRRERAGESNCTSG